MSDIIKEWSKVIPNMWLFDEKWVLKAHDLRLTPNDFLPWQEENASVKDMVLAKKKNIGIESFPEWKELGLSVRNMIDAKIQGVTLEEYKEWRKFFIMSMAQILSLIKSGVSIKETSFWTSIDCPISKIVKAKKLGLSLIKE
jgi:hypothetical protein